MSSRIDRPWQMVDGARWPILGSNDPHDEELPSQGPTPPGGGLFARRLPNRQMPATGAAGVSGRGPVPSVLVHGSSRSLVNLLLYAVSENANQEFRWLDVRTPEESVPRWDPVRLGWIDSKRVWTIDPVSGLEPDHLGANAALFEIVRSDEPPETLAHIAEFLRLPALVQEILGEMPPTGNANLLAVSNVDRLEQRFDVSVLGPALSAFAWARCALFVGYTGPTPPGAEQFTQSIRIEGDSPTLWRDARIHFERGAPLTGARRRRSVSPTDVAFVDRVFRKARL